MTLTHPVPKYSSTVYIRRITSGLNIQEPENPDLIYPKFNILLLVYVANFFSLSQVEVAVDLDANCQPKSNLDRMQLCKWLSMYLFTCSPRAWLEIERL